ncbi:hypothetical protein OROHE_012308 [Orobanche hederae]
MTWSSGLVARHHRADMSLLSGSDIIYHFESVVINGQKAGVILNNGRSRHVSNHVGHGNGYEKLDTGAGPHIKDLKYVKHKGAPRRVRRKGPLENGYKKQKATSKMKKGAQQVIETTQCATITSLTQFSEPQWRDPNHAPTMDHEAWDDHFDVGILPFDGLGIETGLTIGKSKNE